MIGMTDILRGIADALPKQYRLQDEKLPDVWTICATLTPVASQSVGRGVVLRTVHVDLTCSDVDFYTFFDHMDKAFNPVVRFAKRAIMPKSVNGKVADGVGHYAFDLQFCDARDEILPVCDNMDVLHTKILKK